MTRNTRKGILISFIFIFSCGLQSQNLATVQLSKDRASVLVAAQLDRSRLQKEDSLALLIGSPMRVAEIIPLALDMNTAGVWTTASGKKTWRLTIDAPLSYGLIICYSQFYIPYQASLRIYNEDYPYDVITYTSENNPKGLSYATGIASGNRITLEYTAPHTLQEKARIHISEIGYKYNKPDWVNDTGVGLKNFNDLKNKCMVNVNCTEGKDWEKQKNGILRLEVRIGGGYYLCSGSLVNNALNDKTPYLLSASHCFSIESTTADFSQTIFYFSDEFPTCDKEVTRPRYKSITGAEALVINPLAGGSDGALLKLTAPIPSDVEVYYNGWDTAENQNTAPGGVVIHHPLGDVKKMSFYNTYLKTVTNTGTNSATNAHWEVRYSRGSTQGGSSGSPIFNQAGVIVGTLTGGWSSCDTPNESDFFGKFAYHFNQSADTNLWMKKYLDPNNIGITKLQGLGVGDTPDPEPEPRPQLIVYFEANTLHVNAREILRNIRIINLSGYTVYQKKGLDGSTAEIDTSTWSKGVYIVIVEADKGLLEKVKIIK